MFERFTDRARRVVVLAQEEARLLNHNYIGTEHILLGLIHEGEGVAAKGLESLGPTCCQDDPGANSGQDPGEAFPEARAGSGDDDDPVVEPEPSKGGVWRGVYCHGI